MTIFTMNAFKNDYINNPILKEIMKTWEKLEYPVKIFNYNSPEVIDAKKLYDKYIVNCVKNNLLNFATDPIRLYILSKYKDYLYLDTDLACINNNVNKFLSEIESNKHTVFGDGFYFLYSGEDNFFFKDILNTYYTKPAIIKDENILESYGNGIKLKDELKNNFIHLHHISKLFNGNLKDYAYFDENSNLQKNIDKLLKCKTLFISTNNVKQKNLKILKEIKNAAYLSGIRQNYLIIEGLSQCQYLYKYLSKYLNKVKI